MSDTNGHTSALDPATLATFSALVNRMTLAGRIGSMFDGKREMSEVLGYRPVLTYADFRARYERQSFAKTAVTAYPEDTWAGDPVVREDDQADVLTPFEEDWASLVERLMVYAQLEKADVLSNLGSFSTVFIGLANQPRDLSQPARPVRGPDDVLYLTPYSEEWAQIERIEADPNLPTFGQPSLYRINFGRNNATTRATIPVGTALVHASRVLHVAEDCLDDSLYGQSRLMNIYDDLDDMLKVKGGSSEMFWRDAKRRMVLSLHDGATMSAASASTLSDEVDEYMHGLRDFLRVQGMDVQNLAGRVDSPKDHFDMLLTCLSMGTGIPKRKFMGAELGQLASDQNEEQWQQRIRRRKVRFAEARMLRPLIAKLLALRAVRPWVQPYQVTWPEVQTMKPTDRAVIAQQVATALNTYASGQASLVVPVPEFREVYLDLLPEPDTETAVLDTGGMEAL